MTVFRKELLQAANSYSDGEITRRVNGVSELKTISAIIPALNEERYIASCLQSLNDQNARPDEIIVVDGGSLDGTLRVCLDMGAKVVHNGAGLAESVNHGAKSASSEILVLADADAVYDGRWISLACNSLGKTVVAVSAFVYPQANSPIWLKMEYMIWNFLRWSASKVGRSDFFCTTGSTILVRKDAFNSVGGWRPNDGINVDGKFGQRLSKLGRIVVVPKIMTFHATRKSKMGFIRFQRYYMYVLSDLPILNRFSIFRKLGKLSYKVMAESHADP